MTLIAANQTTKPEGTYDQAEAYYDRMQTLPEGMRNSRNWAICKRDGNPVSDGPEVCETDEVLWDMATDHRAIKLITAHDDEERFDTDLFVKAKDKTPVLLSWAQQLHKMRWDFDEALDILLSIPCVGAYYMQTEGDPEHKAWKNVAREIEKVWTAKSSTGTHPQAMAAVVSTQPNDLIIPQGLIKIETVRELAGNGNQPTMDTEMEETVLLIGGQTIEELDDFSKKIIEKCKEMWDRPDTLDKIVEFVQTCHQGDTTAIKIVLLAIMQHRIQTINEMTYISINAGSGGGKSDIVQSITSILPPDDFILGSASAKFIPRKGEKWDGKIIIYDDQQPDPQNIEYIKICNGACKGKRPVYYVLEPGNKNEPTEYPLPLRLCYIIARVDTSWGADAEQVQNRMLTVYLDESSAHKALSRKRMAKRMTINYVDTYRREAEIMRTHLWANLPDKIWVDVSHIEGHIDCQNIENRMYGHLLNMIACNAVYRQWKSTEEARSDAGGEWKEGTEHEPVMYAEKEDAEPIIDLFNMLLSADPNSADPNAGGNIHKFTKNGKRIHDAILKKYPRSPKKWESLRQMATDLNIPRESLRLGLYGRKEAKTAEALTGIILEMPGLDSEKITKYKDACEADGTTKRSQPFYPITWDPEEYHRQPQTVIKWIDDEQQQGTT